MLKFAPEYKVLFQSMGSSRSLTTLSPALCLLSKGLVVKSHLSSYFPVSPNSEQSKQVCQFIVWFCGNVILIGIFSNIQLETLKNKRQLIQNLSFWVSQ